MGRVFAISGFAGDNVKLYEHAVKMTRKKNPNVLYIGTAGSDQPERIENMQSTFAAFGCQMRALCLITRQYTEEELDEILAWADLIYVGGGDTVTMLRIWHASGVSRRLKEIYRNDTAVLAGVSAGAICWFACGHSDSESFHQSTGWSFCWAEGALDLFHKAFCPHYNETGRDSFDQMLIQKKPLEGVALENGVAFVEDGDQRFFVRSDPQARAFAFSYEGDVLHKAELPIYDLPLVLADEK